MKILANDPSVPLCFDTSALYGFKTSVKFLHQCRKTWPTRDLLIPSIVVAEQVRHWIKERGPDTYDATKFDSFLENYKVPGFDRDVATNSWHTVLASLRPEPPTLWPWRYDEKPALLQREQHESCAQVCRWPDHGIRSIAQHHGAILVTDDHALLADLAHETPGALRRAELEKLLT